jgi:hypothetical protein
MYDTTSSVACVTETGAHQNKTETGQEGAMVGSSKTDDAPLRSSTSCCSTRTLRSWRHFGTVASPLKNEDANGFTQKEKAQ